MSKNQIEEQQKAGMEDPKDCTLEQVFERLEQIIVNMEEEASLEKSFQMYHQGMELIFRRRKDTRRLSWKQWHTV